MLWKCYIYIEASFFWKGHSKWLYFSFSSFSSCSLSHHTLAVFPNSLRATYFPGTSKPILPRGHSHSTCARRGEGVAKKRMFAYEGEGGSLRSSTYACKKNCCTFSSLLNKMKQLEQPQISDITQKHDKNNTFHNEYFLL